MAKDTGTRASGTNVSFGLPPGPPPSNHGKTPAAWITTLTIAVGGLICAFGMIIPSTPLIVIGAAGMVIGLIVGRVMRAMGLGQRSNATAPPPRSTSSPRG